MHIATRHAYVRNTMITSTNVKDYLIDP